LRLPHFLDSPLTYDGEVVSLTRWPAFTPGKILVLISVRDRVDPRDIVRLEGLGQLKISNDVIGNRTCDPRACNRLPKSTTVPHAPCPHETFMIHRIKRDYFWGKG
jgi:hypothetical protein